MTENEIQSPPVRFDKERNREEFVAIHGFDPQAVTFEPKPLSDDLRDQRDPTIVGEDHLRRAQKRPR